MNHMNQPLPPDLLAGIDQRIAACADYLNATILGWRQARKAFPDTANGISHLAVYLKDMEDQQPGATVDLLALAVNRLAAISDALDVAP